MTRVVTFNSIYMLPPAGYQLCPDWMQPNPVSPDRYFTERVSDEVLKKSENPYTKEHKAFLALAF